jgi:hypothetical protein
LESLTPFLDEVDLWGIGASHLDEAVEGGNLVVIKGKSLQVWGGLNIITIHGRVIGH